MDKENHITFPSPLIQRHNNIKSIREELRYQKHDYILSALQEQINNNTVCDLFQVILTDLHFKELNFSLQKQALQKRSKLLESFPLRYKNLVQTEILYRKLQQDLIEEKKDSQQMRQLQQAEREQLAEQIQYYNKLVQMKNEEIAYIKEEHKSNVKELEQKFCRALATKDNQITKKIQQNNEIQRKMIKIKCEKDSLNQYLEELKVETDSLKHQNERIIQLVTSHEQQINRVNIALQEKEELYQSSQRKFVEELTHTQLECKSIINAKGQQCNYLSIQGQNVKQRLKQCQDSICTLLNQRKRMQNMHIQQIKKLKERLLSLSKEKNELENQLQSIKHEKQNEIANLQEKFALLSRQIINKDIEIEEKSLNSELQIHKIREMHRKLAESKDQTIEQIKQNVNLIVEEKLFIQSKAIKLESEKEQLFLQIEKFKNELEIQSKKILQISFQSKKVQEKNLEVDKIRSQFKDQLLNFIEIIKQREQKIQEYRKDIMQLRSKNNEAISEKQVLVEQLQIYVNNNSILVNQVDRLRNELQRCTQKQNVLLQQIDELKTLINKKKQDSASQFQTKEGFNNLDQLKLETLNKELEKIQSKYQNLLQQLQYYKKQYKEEITEKDYALQALKNDNKHMKQMIEKRLDESSEFSQLLNTKIEQLKIFYEQKIMEEDKKYRSTIDVLKKEMIELYKEIDLKKSMEEEMFNQIVKINKERKARKEETQG